MDKERLGRALGYGARHAVKTVAAVAEAATAPASTARGPVVERAARAEATARRVPSATAAKKAGRSVWAPLATYSSALWLRVTGLFFGVVAGVMLSGAWRTRAALHAGGAASGAGRHFWVFVMFGVLFGYFAVSGFLRASARERRGA